MNDDFLVDALAGNSSQLPLIVEKLLTESLGPNRFVACQELEIELFSELNLCSLDAAPLPCPSSTWEWGGEESDQLYNEFDQVLWNVEWNGKRFQVLHLEWAAACGTEERNWVICESLETAREFILEVNRKTHAPGDAILVFSNGYWERSKKLFAATQKSSLIDLILADDLKSVIRNDFQKFLNSESNYQQLGIPWKRGALFIGPPGNGKTHFVRALIKELGVSSLYVQSLDHQYYTAEQMWQKVFEKARGLTPCILVLEDLDSLVKDENRSFFLNQLDGFQENHGLIILATTNYPDRIDAAIIDRPSRFDRKYHFNLPDILERQTYMLMWQSKLVEETGWTTEHAKKLGKDCTDFSFAYLKELVVSSLMAWVGHQGSDFEEMLESQFSFLKKQMKTFLQDEQGEPND